MARPRPRFPRVVGLSRGAGRIVAPSPVRSLEDGTMAGSDMTMDEAFRRMTA